MRITMLYDSTRYIAAAPASPLRPQAQIRVFAVQEKRFVEQADLFEHLPAVQRRRATWKQRLRRFQKTARRRAVAALFAGSIAGNQHARRIELPGSGQPHLRGEHSYTQSAGARMSIGVRQQR